MAEEQRPKRRRWLWILGIVVALAIVANLAPDETPSTTTIAEASPTTASAVTSECEEAFAEAALVDEMQDRHEDIFPAVRACGSVEEWSAASAQYPAALDGADPETYLANICASYPEISSEPLCP